MKPGAPLFVYFLGIMMPILVLAMIWLVLSPGIIAQWQAPVLWTRQVAGPVENSSVDSMAADSSYVYAAGHVLVAINNSVPPVRDFQLNVPRGPSYYFLTKYGRKGEQLWNQHFGNPGAIDFAAGTAIANGAVYVAASANWISILLKYDANGNSSGLDSLGIFLISHGT